MNIRHLALSLEYKRYSIDICRQGEETHAISRILERNVEKDMSLGVKGC